VVGERAEPQRVIAVGAAVERVGVEEDEVGRVTDADRAPAVGRRGERLAGGDGLLGVPGLPLVGGAVDGRGDRQPGVERRDRRVRAEHHVDPGVDLEDVVEALTADGCFTPTSLDGPVGDGTSSLGDLLGFDDHAVAAAEARIVLEPVVRKLSERDRRILHLRFVEERTQQEIAEEIGLTQAQVSRVLTRILAELRSDLADLADLSGSSPAA
jgi:RNA polymerase sigma factor (sigma-70 family)